MTITASPTTIPQGAVDAYNYYTTQGGLSPAQAAGLVGNEMSESGMNPSAVNPIGPHTGIVQWSTSRWASLVAFASQIGQPTNALSTQLQFSMAELNGAYAGVLAALKATNTPAAAATVIFNQYEIAGDSSLPGRIDNANAVYATMTGKNPPPGSSAAAQATAGNDQTSGSTNDCQIGWNWPSAGPLGGGKVCVWKAGWSRALLGGACIAAGGIIGIVSVVLLTAGTGGVGKMANGTLTVVSKAPGAGRVVGGLRRAQS